MFDKFYSEISPAFNQEYFDSFVPRLFGICDILFSDVHIFNGGVLDSIDDSSSVIFVSNHKSLADIPLSASVFVNSSVKMPRYVGGNNLHIRGFTRDPSFFRLPDLKKVGMISIDRTRFISDVGFDKKTSGFSSLRKKELKRENLVYKKAFAKFMRDFFEGGENLFFYPEGGRSYSGVSGDLKKGLLALAHSYASSNTLIVPVYNNYSFVIDAPGFENKRSTKYSSSGKFRTFVKDFSLFYNHYRSKRYLLNEAVFKIGDPLFIKDLDLSDLVSYIGDSFNSMTVVSPSEVAGFVLNKNKFLFNKNDLFDEAQSFLGVVPSENLSPEILGMRGDVEAVFLKGVNLINFQKESVIYDRGVFGVVDSFLIDYYGNSVSSFYDSLKK